MELKTSQAVKQDKPLKQVPRKITELFRQLTQPLKTDEPHQATTEPVIEARITRVEKETHDSKSYFFTTNTPLMHIHAGSHINIQLDCDGEKLLRTYTLSSRPQLSFEDALDKEYSITVKRIDKGLASNWLFSNLKIGDTFKVSQALGQFVLPYHPPGKILLLAAGSGVTPLMSMLRYLSSTGNQSDIIFLNYAKSHRDIIYKKELSQLTDDRSNIKCIFSVESGSKASQTKRINSKQLLDWVPDLADRDIYMCGPQGFMKASMEIFRDLELPQSRIHLENFSPDLNNASLTNYSSQLSFSSLEKPLTTSPGRTILQEAEAAGLEPKSACRTGICRTCRCKKTKGTTINIATGEESTNDNDYILPCVSIAKTETYVEL